MAKWASEIRLSSLVRLSVSSVSLVNDNFLSEAILKLIRLQDE